MLKLLLPFSFIMLIALIKPVISPFSTIMPVSDVINSGLPVALYTIAGVPQAKASTVVKPNVSSSEGLTKTSAVE